MQRRVAPEEVGEAAFAPKVQAESLMSSKPEWRRASTWIPVITAITVSETSHALLKTTSSRLGFGAGHTGLALPQKQSVKRTIRCRQFLCQSSGAPHSSFGN